MRDLKFKIIVIVVALLAALAAMKVTQVVYQAKVDRVEALVRVEVIKNSKLTKINEGLYSKLVADTLTKREMKRVIDSLGLELKNAILVAEVVFKPKDTIKEIITVGYKDSIINIQDFYPSKKNPFIEYSAKYNLKDSIGFGEFKFTPVKLALGIGQNKDGTFRVNTKVPEFIEVTTVDVKALPIAKPKPDNFGLIFGAGYGTNLTNKEQFLKASAGVRVKKIYIEAEGATNNTVSAGLKFEF